MYSMKPLIRWRTTSLGIEFGSYQLKLLKIYLKVEEQQLKRISSVNPLISWETSLGIEFGSYQFKLMENYLKVEEHSLAMNPKIDLKLILTTR